MKKCHGPPPEVMTIAYEKKVRGAEDGITAESLTTRKNKPPVSKDTEGLP
jgi:hypothetical protein